jgi:hypothetical protein
MKEDGNGERREQGVGIKGWLFVCAIALSFLLYGLIMYFAIGDKGPPGWNFGAVEDIPGESIYSTNEPLTGGTEAPEPQHVSQKPSKVDINAGKEPHE